MNIINNNDNRRLLPYVSPDTQAVNLDIECALCQESNPDGSWYSPGAGGINNDDEW